MMLGIVNKNKSLKQRLTNMIYDGTYQQIIKSNNIKTMKGSIKNRHFLHSLFCVCKGGIM